MIYRICTLFTNRPYILINFLDHVKFWENKVPKMNIIGPPQWLEIQLPITCGVHYPLTNSFPQMWFLSLIFRPVSHYNIARSLITYSCPGHIYLW